MARTDSAVSPIDPKTGYCSNTRTFHSIRRPPPLPSATEFLSVTDYVFSLTRNASSPLDATSALIDSASGHSLTYSEFLRQVRSLVISLPPIAKGHVALIVSPTSLRVPVLYFALLSLGVVVSPANPVSSESELTHMVRLANPVIAFSVSSVAPKLPRLPLGTVLLDSPDFDSLLNHNDPNPAPVPAFVRQSDTAAIMYSSGTTGRVKGVELTHRNFVALIAGIYHNRVDLSGRGEHPVSLFTIPLFHVFGFFMLLGTVARAGTLVLMEQFDFEGMLRAVEKYRITTVPVSPPLVVAMVNSELTARYDLSSLVAVGCGGAPLSRDVAQKFKKKFNVLIMQGYGLTETAGGGVSMREPEESERYGSVGILTEGMEGKIVDPATNEALLPGRAGELWLRGPVTMKGYVGDDDATAATLDPNGWLKTGDLCYFDSDGFLCIVGRLKELIKYKAFQVAPVELERLLLSHPEIADAAVIPYPDEEAGEIPMAYIVRKDGSRVAADHIMDYVAKQVSPYKKIRRVAFVNTIPKNAAGKILRRELVNHALTSFSARL